MNVLFGFHKPRLVEMVFPGKVTLQELAAEPCLFSCDADTVRARGGPLANKVLDRIEYNQIGLRGQYVIDVRVQRLMPGMFPSIPGWHCDGVPRDHYYAQPDFTKATQDPRHLVLVISSEDDGVSRTEFTNIPFYADIDMKSGFVYKQLHDHIESIKHKLDTFQVAQGGLYAFDQFAPHRTMPCTSRGWRMFFRLSQYHNPPIANGIQNVQQVYLLSEANGW